MTQLKQAIVLLLTFMPFLAFSQDTISRGEKNTVIENIKVLIESNYVFIDKVKHINNSLDNLNSTGKYDDIKDYEIFAKVLTDDLVDITKDKHFKVQYNPEFIKNNRERRSQQVELENQVEPEIVEEEIDWNLWYAKKENFGFEKVEILDGNIGYIKFNFWQPLDWVKSTIDATMGFVTNTDALIIDLTENQGGYSPTDSYLGSYFFDKNPTIWTSSYNRSTGETKTEYTFQEIGGVRYLNKPVFILVSENSFSLAEQFAYAMKHFGKAKIIGQNSAGASHAITFPEVNDNFSIQVPVLYNIHPVTQTDWEGIGVIPHIKTSKDGTLKSAYLDALDRLIEGANIANNERLLKRYNKIKAELKNREQREQ